MKVLFSKIKKCNKLLLTMFLISLIIYLGSLIFLTINFLSLSGIETIFRILILVLFYLYLFGYLIGGLITLIIKKKKNFIAFFILTILLSGIFNFSSYYIYKTYNKIDKINKNYITYTSNMIALKDTDEENITKIGIISDKNDVEGYILAQEIIKKEKIDKDNLVSYDDYYEMLTALYAKEIDALFITNNYSVIFSSEDLFANIKNDVKVIYEYSKKMENKDKTTIDLLSSKDLTEPFTLLLLGVDSEKDGLNANQAFNGDTLMMITFNPNTLNATMFSIPRDTYVPIACRNGAQNKINSSAASGTKCVINTVENLTGIPIDYYIKVNFKGVVDLVDSLGGIDVDVPVSFCEQDSNRLFGNNEICLKSGEQHLNGEEALALSRHRKTLPRGDFQRVQHQQLVVESIAQKAKTITSVNDFYKVLDAISKNIDTNMTTNKMLSFYTVLKSMIKTSLNNNNFITIDHTYLTGSDLTMYNPSTRMNMYTFQYNKSSLKEIIKLMKVNLELEEPEMIKTFNFSINKEYSVYIAGHGNTVVNEPKEEVLPNLIGQTLSYAQNWAKARGINLYVNYISSGANYSKNLAEGTIVAQSLNAKTLVSSIKSLTVDVIKHEDTQETQEKTPANNDNLTKDEDNNQDNDEDDITEVIPGLDPSDKDENENPSKDNNKDENNQNNDQE